MALKEALAEVPEGKAQLTQWRAVSTVPGKSAACWTHFNTIPNILMEINMRTTRTSLPTKFHFLMPCFLWIFARCAEDLDLHAHQHTNTCTHSSEHRACYTVSAFQSGESHHGFPWYNDSSLLISFELQNNFLFWKSSRKEIVLKVYWSKSAC